MGVLLTPIVLRQPTTLDALRGRAVAVDGNLELYQFLSVMRTPDGQPLKDSQGRITSHLNGLVFRTTRLIADYDIRPIFVFDGPPPDLKRDEIRRRQEARAKSEREYIAAVEARDYATAWSKAVMTSRLTRAMVSEAKTLLTLLGIPWVQAPSEGEAQAAFLARRGDVWAAASKDYDSLLFGAPRLVRFLAIGSTEYLPSKGRSRSVSPEVIDLDANLRALGVTREQLIDVAIMVGTDFHPGIKGVGPKTALKRIREWEGLAKAPEEIRLKLPPNLEEIQAFFREPPVEAWNPQSRGPLRADAALQFLCDERDFSRLRVESALRRLRPSERTRRLDDFT